MMRSWKTWLGIAISVAALWYAMQGVDWHQAREALVQADRSLLFIVFIFTPLVNVVVRAFRWQLLLSPSVDVRFSSCASATAIGLMANNVLPARIGEFVRAYALAKREDVPTGTTLGAMFVERLLDGLWMVATLYILTWLHVFPGWVNTTIEIGFYIVLGFFVFQLFLAWHPQGFIRSLQWISRRFVGDRFEESIERVLVTFIDGFVPLRRPMLMLYSALLATVQWTFITLLLFFVMVAFDLGGAGLGSAFFANAVVSLGVGVPSAPGFVGTFEALIVKSLEVYQIDRSHAFSFAVGYHIVGYVGITLVGFWYFFREGLSWSEIEHSEEEMERELDEEYESEIAPDLDSDTFFEERSQGDR